MGISISADETAPIPRPVTIRFECDQRTDVFCRGFVEFKGSWVDAKREATALGWKESPTGTYWCPACSGK
jgi:hypothetical protein